MTVRPMTEWERALALELAQRIADAADWVSGGDGASRKAAIRRLNGATDNQYGVVQIARALLSSSTAERGMREALKEIAGHNGVLGATYREQAHLMRDIAIAALSALAGEDEQATRGEDAAIAPTDRL